MSEGDDWGEQVEAGLLFLVLDLDPEHLTVAELGRRMAPADPRRREEESVAVERAVGRLKKVGLLTELNGRVVPTPAALRFNELYF